MWTVIISILRNIRKTALRSTLVLTHQQVWRGKILLLQVFVHLKAINCIRQLIQDLLLMFWNNLSMLGNVGLMWQMLRGELSVSKRLSVKMGLYALKCGPSSLTVWIKSLVTWIQMVTLKFTKLLFHQEKTTTMSVLKMQVRILMFLTQVGIKIITLHKFLNQVLSTLTHLRVSWYKVNHLLFLVINKSQTIRAIFSSKRQKIMWQLFFSRDQMERSIRWIRSTYKMHQVIQLEKLIWRRLMSQQLMQMGINLPMFQKVSST